jgi:hypothetical protein
MDWYYMYCQIICQVYNNYEHDKLVFQNINVTTQHQNTKLENIGIILYQ